MNIPSGPCDFAVVSHIGTDPGKPLRVNTENALEVTVGDAPIYLIAKHAQFNIRFVLTFPGVDKKTPGD